MVKSYRVTERSFINGTLCEVGKIVHLQIDSPGSNLELVGGTKEEAPTKTSGGTTPPKEPATPPNPATKGFVAKHAGGGHYRIEDAQGERVGDFSGTKEEAEAEAARMNAGDPDLDDQDNGLPDA